MSTPSPEIKPDQQAVNELLLNPAFQAAIQFAIATGVENALAERELASKPDFVLDSDDLRIVHYDEKSKKLDVIEVERSVDDEVYHNRIQKGREKTFRDRREIDIAANLGSIIPENDIVQNRVAKMRSYGAILKDIHNQKRNTFEDPSAEFATELDILTDELAARLTIMPVDETAGSADDARQAVLLDLQKRGLSAEDVSVVIDKIDAFEQMMITTENEIDEVLLDKLHPAIEDLVSQGRNPLELFVDSEGKPTKEQTDLFRSIIVIIEKIDEPLIKEQVKTDTNNEIRRYIQVGNEMLAEQVAANQNVDPNTPITNVSGGSLSVQQLKVILEQEKEQIEKEAIVILNYLNDIHQRSKTDGPKLVKEEMINAADKAIKKYYTDNKVGEVQKFEKTNASKVINRAYELYLLQNVYNDAKNADGTKLTDPEIQALIQKDIQPILDLYYAFENDDDDAPIPAPVKPVATKKKSGLLKRAQASFSSKINGW